MESHILDSSNVLCSPEVFGCLIFTTFSGVVDEIFGHFTKGTTFLSEVDDHPAATFLGFLDCLFDTKNEVRTTGADVRTEDIAAVAFVVDTEGEPDVGIGHFGRVAKNVNGQTANWREKKLDVMTSD